MFGMFRKPVEKPETQVVIDNKEPVDKAKKKEMQKKIEEYTKSVHKENKLDSMKQFARQPKHGINPKQQTHSIQQPDRSRGVRRGF